MNSILVVTNENQEILFDETKLKNSIGKLFDGIPDNQIEGRIDKIYQKVKIKLSKRNTLREIQEIVLKAIEPFITEEPVYDKIAMKQMQKIISSQVLPRFEKFQSMIEYAVDQGLLRKEMLYFDLPELEKYIDYSRNNEFDFFGIAIFERKYQLRDYDQLLIELPQWTWMRMAMGLSFTQANRDEFVKKIYDKISYFKYMHSHSYNAGYVRSQMSSCFISVVDDSLQSIMEKGTELAEVSKYEGGVGIMTNKLRASGSLIQSINQHSSGPIPFIKIYDVIKNAMLQGTGKRRSALVTYMEPRHYNMDTFLELRDTNGNDYLRTRVSNTALWISDNFMNRVESDKDRYFFDPAETPELTENWGEEFSRWYDYYVEKAEAGELKIRRKESARDFYAEIVRTIAKTGNYWMCFKDTHNRFNQSPHYGMINSSNLCTEISIPNTPTSTAVCIIASLNLSRFYDKKQIKAINNVSSIEKKLELFDLNDFIETIEIAIQSLDNEIDFNFFPHPHGEKNCKDLRSLGLGIMGFAEMLIDFQIPYDSEDALFISDYLGKILHKTALRKSEQLAIERGPFPAYDAQKCNYAPRRNNLLLAIAPTASISKLCGTSSSIDSYYGVVYSREMQFGKFTVIVKQLVEELKEKGLWNESMKNKIIAGGGSIQNIEELDGVINKDIYKTAFEYSPQSQINIAAAWQKHIDQSISRNLYIASELRENIGDYYMEARKKGLKSTYYCFVEKKLQGEKYTQAVNKRSGRRGFGGSFRTNNGFSKTQKALGLESEEITLLKKQIDALDVTRISEKEKGLIEKYMLLTKGEDYVDRLKSGAMYGNACPTDPFEAVMCESCQ